MQNGAAPHTAISSKYVLSDIFQDRLVGKVFSIIWPPYSPDPAPIDFLWPKLKFLASEPSKSVHNGEFQPPNTEVSGLSLFEKMIAFSKSNHFLEKT